MIKETVDLYKTIFESLSDAVVVFDEKKEIRYTNKATESFSLYKREELIGKSASLLISKKEEDKIGLLISKSLVEQFFLENFDTIFLTKERKEIPTALSISSLRDEKEKIIGGFIVFVDTSQIKALLESLDNAKSNLEQKVEERTRELEKAKHALEEANAVLEIKVKARTKELQDLNEDLEKKIKERTKEIEKSKKEIEKKVLQLEKWYSLTIGRELKMAELKEELAKYKNKE